MKYIALLRGINVGGNNKVPMAQLKLSFESLGFSDVRTYINSGNVIFDTNERDVATLGEQCESQIVTSFGFPVRVAIIPAHDLHDALENAPMWWGADPNASHNAMVVIPPARCEDIIKEVGEAKPEYEQIAYHGQVIFWSAPVKTFGRTRWSKIVGTRAYKDITIRNVNTARKLVELTR